MAADAERPPPKDSRGGKTLETFSEKVRGPDKERPAVRLKARLEITGVRIEPVVIPDVIVPNIECLTWTRGQLIIASPCPYLSAKNFPLSTSKTPPFWHL